MVTITNIVWRFLGYSPLTFQNSSANKFKDITLYIDYNSSLPVTRTMTYNHTSFVNKNSKGKYSNSNNSKDRIDLNFPNNI